MTQLSKQVTVLKANGEREIFDEEKLMASLFHAGATEEAVEQVRSHIWPELHNEMTTNDIYRHAFSVLQKISKPIARSYSLRRAVMDLGPSGFPFEDFIAKVLEAKGYKCQTRQTVLGECVAHEVDVVAYNEKELIMIEAKFHNDLGTKSDLKVVLYIKARFDDLRDNVFDYGASNRHITGCWLVTNTKFSSTAIHYGICQNLTMIGWNYPEKGSLQDMIESEALHPITCLISLSTNDKKALLENRTVLCSDIKKNPKLLNEFLGKNFNTEPVMNEINEL
ncbi:MAG: restriction endonuclease [Patescibacteria group bacterium]